MGQPNAYIPAFSTVSLKVPSSGQECCPSDKEHSMVANHLLCIPETQHIYIGLKNLFLIINSSGRMQVSYSLMLY